MLQALDVAWPSALLYGVFTALCFGGSSLIYKALGRAPAWKVAWMLGILYISVGIGLAYGMAANHLAGMGYWARAGHLALIAVLGAPASWLFQYIWYRWLDPGFLARFRAYAEAQGQDLSKGPAMTPANMAFFPAMEGLVLGLVLAVACAFILG